MIIVPGYGLAVAQAQHTLRQLVDVLTEKRGVQVDYAIHPVAGRMPGHMNVLLAEAQVPYEQLKEMPTRSTPSSSNADVALVVGANDVVNPAAETTPGAPIYGMPILHANQARQVVFMKRSMRPGFAGIENELLYEPHHHPAVRRRQGHAWPSCWPRSRRCSPRLGPTEPDELTASRLSVLVRTVRGHRREEES